MKRAMNDPALECPIEDIIKDDQELIDLVDKANDGDIGCMYHVANAQHWYMQVCLVRKEEQYKQCINTLKRMKQENAKKRMEFALPASKRQRK
ncbi:hypothetical protein F442_14577 [Phytophthora nicotianae P10297]|nr:hypothetical protein F442_14577 [Phytophthora nicotianae P10297]